MTIDEIHIGDIILTCHDVRFFSMPGFVRPLTIDGYSVKVDSEGSTVTEIYTHSENGKESFREEFFYGLFLTPEAAEQYVRERAVEAHADIEARLNRSLEEIELMHQSIIDRDADTD